MITVGSLFSGAGLCDLGLSWAGFEHRFFCECDPFCQSILRRHWPGVPVFDDVRTLMGTQLPSVDVLCGGFPCQDVSVGGNREGIKENTRSGLWFEYSRLIEEVRPRYAIIENVPGLLSKGMDIVLRDLSKSGYDAEWDIISAGAFGAPHLRERLLIIAYPNGSHASQVRAISAIKRNLGENIKPEALSRWLGIRFDRSNKSSAFSAYPSPILCRVDDGVAKDMDKPDGLVPCAQKTVWTSREQARQWIPMMRALGNGILPQQSFAVAACILELEGLPVPKLPSAAADV